VLNKQARLSPDELREVRQHTVTGRRILEPFLSDDLVLSATRWHHEWWDGRGYPDGLAGENIPLVARVIAVAEALAALTRPRAYRGALAWDETLAEVRALAGTQYDPDIVALLDRCEGRLLEIYRTVQPHEDATVETNLPRALEPSLRRGLGLVRRRMHRAADARTRTALPGPPTGSA
jgi:HD-GYP domain-containing protein (c-di-GMP phosphodiesterase class II)